MITLSHPTANQNVRQTALALATEGLLDEFWTCLNWNQDGIVDRLLGVAPKVRSELRRRAFPPEIQPLIRTQSFREASRQLAILLGLSRLVRGEKAVFGIDAVYEALDRRVARRITTRPTTKVAYAYDGGAWATFRAAKSLGIKCIYEHAIVHWRLVRRYQEEEAELSPEWAATLGALSDSEEKLQRKDEELALADVIVTPSSFSRESLALAPQTHAPIHVIPYGMAQFDPGVVRRSSEGKLKVIYVGALTQAKGLGYLLEAVARLEGEISFTVVGRRVHADVPPTSLLEKYRWLPSLAHPNLLEEMRRHDVLVLPSLHEGFGLVLTEAMGQGLVVITTPHTAGPDLLTDGVDGWLVPIRSAEAIEEKLALLARDRPRLDAMQEAAARKAAVLTWEYYRRKVATLAREVIGIPAHR